MTNMTMIQAIDVILGLAVQNRLDADSDRVKASDILTKIAGLEKTAISMVTTLKKMRVFAGPSAAEKREARAKLSGFEDQILEVIYNQDGFTTSDLQGHVSVIVDKIYKLGHG